MEEYTTLANMLAGGDALGAPNPFPHGYPRFPNLDPRAYFNRNALSAYGELPVGQRMWPGLVWALMGMRAGGPTGYRGDWMGEYMRMMNEPPTAPPPSASVPPSRPQSQGGDPPSFYEMWSQNK